jgi:hypothetical protein
VQHSFSYIVLPDAQETSRLVSQPLAPNRKNNNFGEERKARQPSARPKTSKADRHCGRRSALLERAGRQWLSRLRWPQLLRPSSIALSRPPSPQKKNSPHHLFPLPHPQYHQTFAVPVPTNRLLSLSFFFSSCLFHGIVEKLKVDDSLFLSVGL